VRGFIEELLEQELTTALGRTRPWCMDRPLGSEEIYNDFSYLCSGWVSAR